MSRDFGLVKSSLWGSSRFRRLGSDTARLAYIYLHANEHGSAIGCYRLPMQYVAADLSCSVEAARDILADLVGVDLIDYDDREMVVRIRKWFDHNPITNPKHLIGAVRSFHRLPSLTMFLPSLAVDIIASSWGQAKTLLEAGHERRRSSNAKSREFGERNLESAAQMLEQMKALRDTMMGGAEIAFRDALSSLTEGLSIALSEALQIPLSIHDRQETRNSNSNSNSNSNMRRDSGSPTDSEAAAKIPESLQAVIASLGDGILASPTTSPLTSKGRLP